MQTCIICGDSAPRSKTLNGMRISLCEAHEHHAAGMAEKPLLVWAR